MDLQNQNQQMAEQMAQMQEQLDALRQDNTELTDTISGMGANLEEGFAGPGKAAEEGGGPETYAAMVNQARENGIENLPEMGA